jgi:hypothetical protein
MEKGEKEVNVRKRERKGSEGRKKVRNKLLPPEVQLAFSAS